MFFFVQQTISFTDLLSVGAVVYGLLPADAIVYGLLHANFVVCGPPSAGAVDIL